MNLFRFAQTDEAIPTEISPEELQQTIENEVAPEITNYQVPTDQLEQSSGILAGIGITFVLIYLAVLIFTLVCMAKIFIKAGRKWWEAIVPIYNIYVLLKIVGRPGWWLLLFFIPFVNIIPSVIVSIDLARAFGKDVLVGILILLLGPIMYAVMAFSKEFQYVGPVADPNFKGNQTPPANPTATPVA